MYITKKKLDILLRLALVLLPLIATLPSPAQDTLKTSMPSWDAEADSIVGGTDDLKYSQSVPLVGNPTLNRLTGRQSFDEPYSHYFCELKYVFGADYVRGCEFAYVGRHWGGYGSLMGGYNSLWATGGAAVRPFAGGKGLDWQLYGGIAFNGELGYEFGTRFAIANSGSAFSLWSATVGFLNVGNCSFSTLGISIGLISLGGFILL